MKKEQKNNLGKLTTIALTIGILVSITTYMLPIKKTSINTLYIDRQAETENTTYFTYEGLYSQQTAERFTDTVKGLLTSENIVGETLESADIENNKQNRKKFIKELSIKKTGPQILSVKLTGEYYKNLDELFNVVDKYINEINSETQKGVLVKTVSSKSIIETNTTYPILNGLVATLLVLFIGGIVLERKLLLKLI